MVHNDTYPAIDSAKADLSGKAVFISGASRGLGRSIALSFAKAGASQIAIAARSPPDEVARELKEAASSAGKKEPHVLALKLEITDAQSVTDAGKVIEQEFGKLDVVINNAGVIGKMQSILDGDPESWWQTCIFRALSGSS